MASKPTGKPGDKWARIGNAVPPKMMQAIALPGDRHFIARIGQSGKVARM